MVRKKHKQDRKLHNADEKLHNADYGGDGGLPNAAASGRNLVKRLCELERRGFKTAEPRKMMD
jgi:hypothetical protein